MYDSIVVRLKETRKEEGGRVFEEYIFDDCEVESFNEVFVKEHALKVIGYKDGDELLIRMASRPKDDHRTVDNGFTVDSPYDYF